MTKKGQLDTKKYFLLKDILADALKIGTLYEGTKV